MKRKLLIQTIISFILICVFAYLAEVISTIFLIPYFIGCVIFGNRIVSTYLAFKN